MSKFRGGESIAPPQEKKPSMGKRRGKERGREQREENREGNEKKQENDILKTCRKKYLSSTLNSKR